MILFVGVIIENLLFELNLVLLLCCCVYVLEVVLLIDIVEVLECVLGDCECGLGEEGIEVVFELLLEIVIVVDGDVCCVLILLEIVVELVGGEGGCIILQILIQVLVDCICCFDKGGEQFYDQILVLYKLVCSFNFDVVLYWLICMLDGGCDLFYFVCWLICMVIEDIGLVDLCV